MVAMIPETAPGLEITTNNRTPASADKLIMVEPHSSLLGQGDRELPPCPGQPSDFAPQRKSVIELSDLAVRTMVPTERTARELLPPRTAAQSRPADWKFRLVTLSYRVTERADPTELREYLIGMRLTCLEQCTSGVGDGTRGNDSTNRIEGRQAVSAVDVMPDIHDRVAGTGGYRRRIGFVQAGSSPKGAGEDILFPDLPNGIHAFGAGQDRFHWVVSEPASASPKFLNVAALVQFAPECKNFEARISSNAMQSRPSNTKCKCVPLGESD